MTFDPSPFRGLYPFSSHFLDRKGLKYHYLDEGEGEPVLMVHGNPSWSFLFRRLVSALRDSCRVIVPDHIGCGLSDKPGDDRYEYCLENRVDDLEALIAHLHPARKITLVLHDWGGAIGMGFAMRHAENIKRIILMNTGAFHLPPEKPFPWPLYVFRNMMLGSFLALGLNGFSSIASYTAVRKPMSDEVRRGFVAPYDTWENRIATLRFVQDIPLFPGDRSYDLISRIQASLPKFRHLPVLMCWGKKDWVFDHHFFRRFKEYFPGAETHTFDAGHYVLEDEHEKIIPLVVDFLKRHG